MTEEPSGGATNSGQNQYSATQYSATDEQNRPHRGAYIALAIVILTWGVNWPFLKMGLESMSPLWFAFARNLIACTGMFIFLALRRQIKFPVRQDWPIVFSVAIVQITIFVGLVHLGTKYIPAGRASVLAYTSPIWVAPLAILFLGELLNRMKVIGFLAGIAGLVVLFNPLSFDWEDSNTIMGNGVILLGAFFWACSMLHVRAHHWHGTALELLPWQMLLALLPTLAIAYFIEGIPVVVWSQDFILILAYNGLGASALGYWALLVVGRALPAITTSLALLGVPAGGIISGAIVLGETITPALIAGVLLIGLCVFFMVLADRPRASHQNDPKSARPKAN